MNHKKFSNHDRGGPNDHTHCGGSGSSHTDDGRRYTDGHNKRDQRADSGIYSQSGTLQFSSDNLDGSITVPDSIEDTTILENPMVQSSSPCLVADLSSDGARVQRGISISNVTTSNFSGTGAGIVNNGSIQKSITSSYRNQVHRCNFECNTINIENFEIMIPDKKCNMSDFYYLISTVIYHIDTIFNGAGLNLLHMVVESNRPTFQYVIFTTGKWTQMMSYKVPADSESRFSGLTPKQTSEICRMRKTDDELIRYSEWEASMSDFHKAARGGDIEYIAQNLGSSLLNQTDKEGYTPFLWACVRGYTEIVSVILGVLPKAAEFVTSNAESAMHLVCIFGHDKLIKPLLQAKLNPNLKDEQGKTPIERTAENGHTECLKQLGSYMKIDSYVLVIAAQAGRLDYLKYGIEKLQLQPMYKDDYLKTPIMRAIENGWIDIVKYLLGLQLCNNNIYRYICNFTDVDVRKRTMIHLAAEGNQPNIVLILIENIIKTKGKKMLKKLINAHDKFNGGKLCFLIRGRDSGRKAWHYIYVKRHLVSIFFKAVKDGSTDLRTFGELMESGWGPNPDRKTIDMIEDRYDERKTKDSNPDDMTPLHISLYKGNVTISSMLIDNGADVNAKDRFGLTPLHYVAMTGTPEMATVLESKKANMEARDENGNTPLVVAEMNKNESIVNYLKGRKYLVKAKQFKEVAMSSSLKALDMTKLENMQRNGEDVKKHLVSVLRDLTIDINQILMDVGSGPVMEETT